MVAASSTPLPGQEELGLSPFLNCNFTLLIQQKEDPYCLLPSGSKLPLHQIQGPEMPGRLEKIYTLKSI